VELPSQALCLWLREPLAFGVGGPPGGSERLDKEPSDPEVETRAGSIQGRLQTPHGTAMRWDVRAGQGRRTSMDTSDPSGRLLCHEGNPPALHLAAIDSLAARIIVIRVETVSAANHNRPLAEPLAAPRHTNKDQIRQFPPTWQK
jgi:hypothetical protein